MMLITHFMLMNEEGCNMGFLRYICMSDVQITFSDIHIIRPILNNAVNSPSFCLSNASAGRSKSVSVGRESIKDIPLSPMRISKDFWWEKCCSGVGSDACCLQQDVPQVQQCSLLPGGFWLEGRWASTCSSKAVGACRG